MSRSTGEMLLDPDSIDVESLRAIATGRRWTQLDVHFEGDPRTAGEHLDAVLRDTWCALARAGVAPPLAWFLRKPPGLRIRIDAEAAAVAVERVRAVLDAARGCGVGWSTGEYEAEWYRFGGGEGLALAHRFLSASASAWCGMSALRARGDATLDPALAAALLFDDFVERIVADVPERWDVWCRLYQLYFGRVAAPGRGTSGPRLELVRVLGLVTPRERSVLESALVVVRECACELVARRVVPGGLPPRAFATTIATFHWNVWCVSRDQVRRLCELSIAELDPLRGSESDA